MPYRLRDIGAALRRVAPGAQLVDGGTKHNWRVIMDGKRPYTIPASNGPGTEIGNEYINGLCRHLGIDRALFLRILRGEE